MTKPILRKVVEKKRKNGEIVGYYLTLHKDFVEYLKKQNTRFVIQEFDEKKGVLVIRPATPEEVKEVLTW